ncbi:murein transglycosylase B [Aeromonas sp. CA23]|uniref:lytic murein transglycosylase B n=1 Tax=Aeromonas sp. CA23 TaxID=2033032 RepID=UPI000BFC244A|nr:lytic murein transglycosylase B [Aeromonas sp. CA23]ATM00536.1 murein transglycosylase B [Aeromonas sp. CA23]
MRRLVSVLTLSLFPLLYGCSSTPAAKPVVKHQPNSAFINQTPPSRPVYGQGVSKGDFANRSNVDQFVQRMVQKHGFDGAELHGVLAQAQRYDWIIRLMDAQAPTPSKPTGPTGAWNRYRAKFITPDNVQNGVSFWREYESELNRAQQVYGVPPEIIVGIIGVETRWGRVMGKTRILDALATLAFDYPRRAEFFTSELESFLVMTRDEGMDPTEPKGSYAGAMGYGQFMPSSFQRYAVDFNGNGHTNLWDPVDAIGSVANYFKAHGWEKGQPVAVRGQGQLPGYEHGFQTRYPVASLRRAGLTPTSTLGNHNESSLLRLDVGTGYQYWYGLPNFYAITRYNHSTHYAMAVWQLGLAVKDARGGY